MDVIVVVASVWPAAVDPAGPIEAMSYLHMHYALSNSQFECGIRRKQSGTAYNLLSHLQGLDWS